MPSMVLLALRFGADVCLRSLSNVNHIHPLYKTVALSCCIFERALYSHLEGGLTGSREIRKNERKEMEARLLNESAFDALPHEVVLSIRGIYNANSSVKVGFRRANMSALLWRYFTDMRDNLIQVSRVMKSGAKAFYVVGDSRTNAGGNWVHIETCRNVKLIGEMIGLRQVDTIDIDVTTENYKHIKNAITRNQVIVFGKY